MSERKLRDDTSRMKFSPSRFDLAHGYMVLEHIHQNSAKGRAEGAGVDHGNAIVIRPDSGPMGVTAKHKRRGGAMASRELRGLARCHAPGMHHAQNSCRRPHRVGKIMQGELQSVAFRLMALRDGAGDPAEDFKPPIQIVML